MLSVPTLWTAFFANFLAVGLIWAYVMRSYPSFEPASYWTASSLTAAAGAGLGMLRGLIELPVPLIGGGGLLILACCFAAMGVRRFYGQNISWTAAVITVGLSCAGLGLFMTVVDSMPIRIFIYSLGQSVPIADALMQILMHRERRSNPGARLAAMVAAAILGINVIRSLCAFLNTGGNVTIVQFNGLQAGLILALVFLSMAWNFGFLLMAIDRLRNEVADLALLDDLTGVGNRRHLTQRLIEECARSERSGESFALLVIDLDGFKAINDTHGHAAGDACLQHFTLMAQTRLRPGDMLARSGGDEFCIVLPSAGLSEGILIARRILDVCRQDAEGCIGGDDIPIAVSIGVAQWSPEIGDQPERLIAHADHALYAAKKEGKNRYAAYDPSPSLAPDAEPVAPASLRKLA
jgi:diguanylate cyclase (GGDEF)-like protein